jgi:hypothetical protein
VFALAALSKAWNFGRFVKTVAHYPHASRIARPIAGFLISSELVVAVALLFQATALVGGTLAVALLALFSGVLWRFGIPHEGDCGCLGALPSGRTRKDVIVRNTVLILAVSYGVLGPVAWPSAPMAMGIALLVVAGILITRPALQVGSGSVDASRRAALYKMAVVGGALALLPLLRLKEAFACVCGEIVSCGSCNHYVDYYYSGCCVNCTCSPPKKKIRRKWYQTCSVCCEGNEEYYCFTTYVCVSC